jgi:hypothetical protein
MYLSNWNENPPFLNKNGGFSFSINVSEIVILSYAIISKFGIFIHSNLCLYLYNGSTPRFYLRSPH